MGHFWPAASSSSYNGDRGVSPEATLLPTQPLRTAAVPSTGAESPSIALPVSVAHGPDAIAVTADLINAGLRSGSLAAQYQEHIPAGSDGRGHVADSGSPAGAMAAEMARGGEGAGASMLQRASSVEACGPRAALGFAADLMGAAAAAARAGAAAARAAATGSNRSSSTGMGTRAVGGPRAGGQGGAGEASMVGVWGPVQSEQPSSGTHQGVKGWQVVGERPGGLVKHGQVPLSTYMATHRWVFPASVYLGTREK
jgi:hypothetical protein